METSEKLPNGWKWVDESDPAYPLRPVIRILKGEYPNRGCYVCVFRHSDGWFYVRRHGGFAPKTYEITLMPDDIACNTLEEAKALSLTMIRLVDEGR